ESFSYSVSHDLRAPLRHIAGFVELLEKTAGAKLDEGARRYLKIIHESGQHAGRLVDDLLAFSRMGRSELRFTEIDLDRLVGEVRQEVEPEGQGRNIEWCVAKLPRIHADPAMLRLAVRNLLSNAIKYTRPRPVARIEVDATEADGEVVVRVRDNGVGFDMRYAG